MPNIPRPGKGFEVDNNFDLDRTPVSCSCIENLYTDAISVRKAVFPNAKFARNTIARKELKEKDQRFVELGYYPQLDRDEVSNLSNAEAIKQKSDSRMGLLSWYHDLVRRASISMPDSGSRFWVRSLARGYAMQYLNHGDKDRRCLAFAMGFLTEIGTVLVALSSGVERSSQGDKRGIGQGFDCSETESYSDIGYDTLKRWGFPDPVCLAAKCSLNPNANLEKFREWQKSYFRAAAVSLFVTDRFLPPTKGDAKAMGIKETFFVERDAFEYAVAAIERDLSLPEFAIYQN